MKAFLVIAFSGLAMLSAAALAQGYGGGYGGEYGGGYGGRHNPDSDRWDTIGNKRVNSGFDQDHLRVRSSDRYNKIRVCSLDRAIQLNGISVRFHSGDQQDIPVNMIIRGGDCTPPLDLDGRRRNMDEIYLSYGKLHRGGEPRVSIQAR